MTWHVAAQSAIGTSHQRRNGHCQDAAQCLVVRHRQAEWLIAVAADGAGSAPNAREGAELACSSWLAFVQEQPSLVDFSKREFALWHEQFIAALPNARDYACTFMTALISDEVALFFQIGDGVIVVQCEEEWRYVFWPEKGEFVNTTVFLTSRHALEHLHVHRCEAKAIDRLVVMTDGLQHLALQYEAKRVFEPFFTSLFTVLNRYNPSMYPQLVAQFLQSPMINERTDDDKTLIIATRSR